jgi:predicted ATPase
MIKTNWNIITGSPSSGKSSVLEYISMKGVKVFPEVARVIMKNYESKGNELSKLTNDKEKFEKLILKSKQQLEKNTQLDKTVFFDRSLIDSYAFAHHYKINISKEQKPKYLYNKVFYLEPLPYKVDNYRLENEKDSLNLAKSILHFYDKYGYQVVKIPLVSIEERARLILNTINYEY